MSVCSIRHSFLTYIQSDTYSSNKQLLVICLILLLKTDWIEWRENGQQQEAGENWVMKDDSSIRWLTLPSVLSLYSSWCLWCLIRWLKIRMSSRQVDLPTDVWDTTMVRLSCQCVCRLLDVTSLLSVFFLMTLMFNPQFEDQNVQSAGRFADWCYMCSSTRYGTE